MKELELGGLRVRMAGGSDGDGGGDGPLFVLLHGFGAPGDDLVPIGRVLGSVTGPPTTPSVTPRPWGPVRFAFPEAPMDLGPAYAGGRAWWWIDLEARERARARGEQRDLSTQVPEGLAEARARVVALLDDTRTLLGVDPARTVIGGFSQGAMLTCDVALRTSLPLAALVMLSGTLIASQEWLPLMPARRGLRVFQSHGTRDAMLPFALAERLRDSLTAAGAGVTWIPFEGGHEIPGLVVDALRVFVRGATAEA